ncbi:hypothetical protein M3J09_012397 [Ascochyta lentis]
MYRSWSCALHERVCEYKGRSYLVLVAPAASARRAVEIAIPTVGMCDAGCLKRRSLRVLAMFTNHSATAERQDRSDAPSSSKLYTTTNHLHTTNAITRSPCRYVCGRPASPFLLLPL